MHISLSLLLTSLTTTALAASVPRQDPHILDFRTWGSKDCTSDNQGIWTFTQSDIATPCRSFASYGATNVQSITLVDIDAVNNHTLFYGSDDCSTDGFEWYFPAPGACYSPPQGTLTSFKIL